MKNINEILNHITNNPSYDKLNIFLEIKRFVNILPLKLKSGIKFVYIKNQTMHFVLTHQLFKVEFEHNKDTLKALLKMADIKDVSNFVFFVSNSVDNLIKKNSENIDNRSECDRKQENDHNYSNYYFSESISFHRFNKNKSCHLM